ncbi:MAG: methyltransferase domain-containing protein [Xanthomonadaceae bacterium]|nr:methyltransferase domain-containing protein [Xanthomonadaceae bacterium]MDP2184368.1 methyltransferase domain-containing protein [Xanthomonadales bacterium]MDZ4116859.1 methyltransferase domain-containing protein [Xanthomonadaceae bacterium]MDZ4378609.1 methyltransferase domain-containing protein [Xanthomonadaceae bacterium]
MASDLHDVRLDTVVQTLLDSGTRRVLDLGCGPGELLLRLAREAQFVEIVGIDIDAEALHEARRVLGLGLPFPGDRIQVRHGSFAAADAALAGFDAAALVETIEHLDPRLLGRMETAVFAGMRPGVVLVTTPNQEYNVVHGMAPGERRHPGHRFEWNRARFRQWAQGVAGRNGYAVQYSDIGPLHPQHGSSTQMAQFSRAMAMPLSR